MSGLIHSRIGRVLLVGLAASLAAGALSAGEVRLVVAPMDNPWTPGSPHMVQVFAMNEGDKSETITIPISITAALVYGDRTVEVELIPESAARQLTVAGGAFVPIRCRLTIPNDVSPRSLLVINGRAIGAQAASPPPAEGQVALDAPTPAPSSDQTVAEAGLVEYRPLQFSAHEPIYFLIGAEEPNGKFQFSFKYQVVPTASPLGKKVPWTTGFHLAYTQLSFWDLEDESKPFFDNNYKPELLWLWDNIRPGNWGPVSRLDLQLGLQHESNGRDGDESRSLNIVYIRPVVTFGERDDWFVSVGPRLWTYVGSLDDNDDIAEFRGYGDLKIVAGKGDGLQLSAVGRIGSDFDKGSLQLDLSYPIGKALFDSIDIYLHGQMFTGFGESLLGYNESDTQFRVGISLVR